MSVPILYADPAWDYDQKLEMTDGVDRSAASQYTTMSVDEICCLMWVRTIFGHQVDDTAILFLWVTNPFLLNGAGVKVCEAWGFQPKQLITWVKGRLEVVLTDDHMGGAGYEPDQEHSSRLVLRTGMGHYTRGCTEHIIVATRGHATSLLRSRNVNNVILAEEETVLVAPRGRHSEKPNEAYELIERLTVGPYLEVFARTRRHGWIQHGNDLI